MSDDRWHERETWRSAKDLAMERIRALAPKRKIAEERPEYVERDGRWVRVRKQPEAQP